MEHHNISTQSLISLLGVVLIVVQGVLLAGTRAIWMEIKSTQDKLWAEIKDTQVKLLSEIKETNNELRNEIRVVHTELNAFKEESYTIRQDGFERLRAAEQRIDFFDKRGPA